jgi:hypothetical protein
MPREIESGPVACSVTPIVGNSTSSPQGVGLATGFFFSPTHIALLLPRNIQIRALLGNTGNTVYCSPLYPLYVLLEGGK